MQKNYKIKENCAKKKKIKNYKNPEKSKKKSPIHTETVKCCEIICSYLCIMFFEIGSQRKGPCGPLKAWIYDPAEISLICLTPIPALNHYHIMQQFCSVKISISRSCFLRHKRSAILHLLPPGDRERKRKVTLPEHQT